MFTGTSTDRTKVADAVSGAVLAYARHGQPGWPEYDADSRMTRRFDIDSTLLTDPEAELRRLWLDTGDLRQAQWSDSPVLG
jgi:para-nitrobenzyl esterase